MNNTSLTNSVFIISDCKETKEKVLNWANQFSTFCFLDNHQYQLQPHSLECLLGAGIRRKISCSAGNALQQLGLFIQAAKSATRPDGGWLFGHLGYDLKNEIEQLQSSLPDRIGFPDLFFFEPEVIIRLTEKEMIIEAPDPGAVYKEIENTSILLPRSPRTSPVIKQGISGDVYRSVIGKLKQHILRGDCYEINFCQEFYADDVMINPVEVYLKLSSVSPNPFSALYKLDNRWLICASPERYLKKQGRKILSQPIKGTARRIDNDKAMDQQLRHQLLNSTKDRSENVMVVDLVRNDLARICDEGTVQVDELYGVYSFPQVHQMISSVSGQLKEGVNFSSIIQATFPMGSMTGAPKKRVMELIEKYEQSKRGIFSGALGYIMPGGDFDFNVVIRSILYNETTARLSFPTGSAITFYSDANQEWEECLLKGEAIKRVFNDMQG